MIRIAFVWWILILIVSLTLSETHNYSFGMYNYYYCNHTGKIHRTNQARDKAFSLTPATGIKGIYVTPNKTFPPKGILLTVPCDKHFKLNIPHCLVAVDLYQDQLQDVINESRYITDLRKTLKNKKLQQSNQLQFSNSSEALSNQLQLSNEPQVSNAPQLSQLSNFNININDPQLSNESQISNPMEIDIEEKNSLYKKIRFAHDETNNAVFGGLAALPSMNNSSSAWTEITSQTLCPTKNSQSKRNKEKAKLKIKTKYYQDDGNDDVYKYIIIHNKVKLPSIWDFPKKK
eukprot:254163_1